MAATGIAATGIAAAGPPPAPMAPLLVADPEARPRAPAALLREAFELTEAEVAARAVTGEEAPALAAALPTSEGTARPHPHRVFGPFDAEGRRGVRRRLLQRRVEVEAPAERAGAEGRGQGLPPGGAGPRRRRDVMASQGGRRAGRTRRS